MNVFVLLQIDSYDRSEVLGVFASVESAKKYAELQEPDRPFPWVDRGDAASVFAALFTGPIYSYDIDMHEVKT